MLVPFHSDAEQEAKVKNAIREIHATYGDVVSVADKAKSLLKFGRNVSLGTTEEMVWLQGGIETLPTMDAITHISSSDAGDAQEVKVEGHTVTGTGASAEFTFVIQTATLNGQTKVELDTPLARATRLYNNDSTEFAGNIYAFEDDTLTGGVPDTDSKIHLKTIRNQSQKAATTISGQDYWIITNVYASVNRQQAASADFYFERREPGGVFRSFLEGTAHSTGPAFIPPLDTLIVIPKNNDFRVTASASASGVSVTAWVDGLLARKMN